MAKKQSDKEKILSAMDALDATVRNLEKFGSRYNSYIDEAAIHGNDARAKQLIKQKIKVFTLMEQVKMLKSKFELGVYSAQALSELGKLPDAIKGCRGLLRETPNWTKLGKSITSIFNDIGASEEALAELNKILEPEPSVSLSSRLDNAAEDEMSDEFKAEYAAMIGRIKPRIAPDIAPSPLGTESAATGDVDYAGIVAEENKKK